MIWGIRSNGDVEMQAIRYPTGKWTEARARSNCEEKGGSFHPASQAAQRIENLAVAYAARFEPIIDSEGRTFVKIHAIDPSTCKNRWRVTPDAMRRNAHTILQAKLLGPPPPGEKGDVWVETPANHRGLWKDFGNFISYEQNGATLGLAEVTHPYAAEKIRSKEWIAVSPKILVNAERRQNGEIVVDDYRFDHILFVDQGAFDRARVVEVCDSSLECGYPALGAALERAITDIDEFFPVTDPHGSLIDAEMMALGLHPENKSKIENRKESDPLDHPLELAAGWLPEGMTQGDLDDGDFAWLSDKYKAGDEPPSTGRKLPYKIHGKVNVDGWKAAIQRASGAGDGTDFAGGPSKAEVIRKLCRDKPKDVESEVCDELEAKGGCSLDSKEGSQDIAEMQERIKALAARVETLETSNKELKQLNDELKTSNKTLMDDKKAREDAEHLALVNSVVDLRIKAGLAKEEERAKVAETFAKMPNDALHLMKPDLERQVNVVAASVEQARAKAKFRAGKTDSGFSVGYWNPAEKKWVS